ncbi:hypothetical protein [Desulfobacula phenolica]|uniref:Uncharacterized protein n=1 Tax=Desulfobacula phenolica TaxID=90732 RepID=A0A1H2HX04_9BACT|nr:hypothetical protein [Desulfobacula phenolica]SDU36068.1 hypothetical protein SAMN04487931_10781 [Desulfobacula phenolica]
MKILIHAKKKDENSKETLDKRIIQMVLDVAIRHDFPSIRVLNAFFS